MKWQEIRNLYPKQWLLIEATKAHSKSNRRIVEKISVISSFTDSTKAMKRYVYLLRKSPERELYIFHSSRKSLDITEWRWLGIRGAL
jgi:hypothetical protein